MADQNPDAIKNLGMAIEAQAVYKSLGDLVESLKKVREQDRSTIVASSELASKLAALAKQSTLTRTTSFQLAQALKLVEDGSEKHEHALEALAKEYESSSGIMTESTKSMFQSHLDDIKKAKAAAGGDARRVAILNAAERRMELDLFQEKRRHFSEEARMIASRGGLGSKIQGAALGIFGAAAGRGEKVALGLGEALGLDAAAMLGVAAVAGTLLGTWAALSFSMKRGAAQTNDYISAGNIQGKTLSEVSAGTKLYTAALRDQVGTSNLSAKVLNQLMAVTYQEGGKARGMGMDFVATMANVGKALGMHEEEAVKFASKMSVLGRSKSTQDSMRAMGNLIPLAEKLNMPMQALSDPMLQLAELAGRTGGSALSASRDLGLMEESVESLRKTGLSMYQNMSGADYAGLTKKFSGMFAGISDMTLSAITYGKFKGFDEMLGGVSKMGAGARAAAVGSLAKQFGLQGNTNSNNYLMGNILTQGALSGDFGAAMGFGAFAKNLSNEYRKKGMSDEDFNKRMGSELDRRITEKRTIGEAIQSGQDPLVHIANTLDKIFDLVTLGVNRWFPGSTNGGAAYSRPTGAQPSATSSAAQNYGVGAMSGRRLPAASR